MKSNSEGLIIDGVVAHIDRDNIDTCLLYTSPSPRDED